MDNRISYVQNNMRFSELLWITIFNVLKALTTAAIIITAAFLWMRFLQNAPADSQITTIVFVATSTTTFVAIAGINWSLYGISDWIYSSRVDYGEAINTAVLSLMIGTIATIMRMWLWNLIAGIIYLTPMAAAPFFAFIYMLRFEAKDTTERILLGLVGGYLFSIGIHVTGIILVMCVDFIGWELTAAGILITVAASAFYLYIDLNEWIRNDINERMTEEQREEERALVIEWMRIADVIPDWYKQRR